MRNRMAASCTNMPEAQPDYCVAYHVLVRMLVVHLTEHTGGLLGGLIVKGALNLQHANTLVMNAAAAEASRGHTAASQTDHRQRIMRGAISVLVDHITPAELQQQLKVAGMH